MPRNLPDVEICSFSFCFEYIFLNIRKHDPKFFGTIDLSGIFFSIPLHVYSKDIINYTRNNKNVPHGYNNGLVNTNMVPGKAI